MRVRAYCRAALEGSASTFDLDLGGLFQVSPVRGADGAVVYGLLLSGSLTKRPRAVAG